MDFVSPVAFEVYYHIMEGDNTKPTVNKKVDLNDDVHEQNVDSSGTKPHSKQYGGYDEYHFIASLLDGSDLVCKVCHLPSRNPHLSSCCGHTFCKSCIDNVKETTTITNACPMCRDSEFPVVQNKQIDRAVRSLRVYCTNEKEGCKWQGEINDIAKHLTCCEYEGVTCENEGCKDIVQRQLLGNHMKLDCLYRDVDCFHCHLTGKHCGFIEGTHKDECLKFPLPCPNGCEVGTVTRGDLDKHREICSLEMITCEYHDMGCKAKFARKDIQDHNRENVEEHLCMVKCELASTKKDLVQAHKDAVTANKRLVELEKKFQEKIDDIVTQGQENIKRLEAQLYNSICQLHKTANPWTLKLDSLAAMSASDDQVVPVVLKMTDFNKLKKEKVWWSSNHFYSYNKECKLSLLVCPAGSTEGESTYLSVCSTLSNYDDDKELPFRGTIILLNQNTNQKHHEVTMDCTVRKNKWVIFKEPLFIAHSNLNAVHGFLKNDSLFFEVHMEMHATEAFEELQQSRVIHSNEEPTTDDVQLSMQQQELHPHKEHASSVEDMQPPLQ